MPSKYPGQSGGFDNSAYAEDTPVTSAARTTTGNSGELVDYSGASTLRVQLDVTAASGTTPALDVLLQDSLDGVNWNTIGTFAQKTAASREVVNVTSPFAKRLRIGWTIAGTTPSFTFAVIVVSQAPAS
jgi:hypothetical protein